LYGEDKRKYVEFFDENDISWQRVWYSFTGKLMIKKYILKQDISENNLDYRLYMW
jgi:hypothetical protein